jgi:putative flavoprotein involved in K+ transport
MTRLPGYRYEGADPDGYMATAELLTFFETYAQRIAAPVEEHTTVRSVRQRDDANFDVATERGMWTADTVVVATGASAEPRLPPFASTLSRDVVQFTPITYKRPAQLPDGNVLVVGGSASGAQLASELRASGKEVVLAVGRHVRLPRRYRGADIFAWLDRAGILDDPASGVRDIAAARRQPSLSLVGSTPPRNLDLHALQQQGVHLAGRLIAASGRHLTFADDLGVNVDAAEAKLRALLARIDPIADAAGAPRTPRPVALRVPRARTTLDVRRARITSVLWATGFTRSYPWLHVPVIDEHGDIRQRDGITPVPGLYTIGMRFQRLRRSNFIDGVGADAQFLARHIAAQHRVRAAA